VNTNLFDAAVYFPPPSGKQSIEAFLRIQRKNIPATIHFYEEEQRNEENQTFVRIQLSRHLSLYWKDSFEVIAPKGKGVLGEGFVLAPLAEKSDKKMLKKRTVFLQELLGSPKEMLYVLVRKEGIKGLKEIDIIHFSSFSRETILSLSQELEAEKKVRIISFSPLWLLSQEGLAFLSERLVAFLSSYHDKHPEFIGVPLSSIYARFKTHSRILNLSLKYLLQAGKVKKADNLLSLSDFSVVISPEEEKILCEMEEMTKRGELQSVSFDDLQQRFRLSTNKLNILLSLLIERRKIVQAKEGFFLHYQWLDEIIKKIRSTGKKEMTVSEFKAMTGLSRKYAIPLLELLDQMGVTRRKGASREIL